MKVNKNALSLERFKGKSFTFWWAFGVVGLIHTRRLGFNFCDSVRAQALIVYCMVAPSPVMSLLFLHDPVMKHLE